ncbi:glutathione S-transferase family protein [Boseongicola aestuarii]|uniref:glutathione S-transferase family protein n=1 Tax=Boseongicola aestuarii TaxID=1470561 RepID=UPI000B946616|nr:glutathione S-transferase family protein [Boseongicola aestuarii]
MKLYWAPGTIASASAIVLEEGNVHWEGIRLNFREGDQMKPAYHAVNPKGRVPALVTPGGVLTETGAILEYLAATAVPGLVPVDPLHAARMREVMYYLASTMHVNHAHKMRGSRWADDERSWADMKAKVPETMAASCAYIEDLVEGPFLFGDHVTLADAWLYTISTWLEADGVDVSRFPKLEAFREAMSARTSVKAVRDLGMMA